LASKGGGTGFLLTGNQDGVTRPIPWGKSDMGGRAQGWGGTLIYLKNSRGGEKDFCGDRWCAELVTTENQTLLVKTP